MLYVSMPYMSTYLWRFSRPEWAQNVSRMESQWTVFVKRLHLVWLFFWLLNAGGSGSAGKNYMSSAYRNSLFIGVQCSRAYVSMLQFLWRSLLAITCVTCADNLIDLPHTIIASQYVWGKQLGNSYFPGHLLWTWLLNTLGHPGSDDVK